MAKTPTAYGCMHCDFGSGYRGMDRCGKCDGMGSVFRITRPDGTWKTFPNTEDGFAAATKMLNASDKERAEWK